MASFSGILHRQASTAVAVAVAAFSTISTDLLPDRFTHPKPIEPNALAPSSSPSPLLQSKEQSISRISISNLFPSEPSVDPNCPLANFAPRHRLDTSFSLPFTSVDPSPALLSLYQYARLANPAKELEKLPSIPSSQSDALYRWHLPDPRAHWAPEKSGCSAKKSKTVVVLLGWLGAKQRHLKRYAEWYTSRGFHVVTFTFPMKEVMSYKVGGNAEQNVELLASHLAGWVAEESGKNLVFHTFSNTGWLTYGVLLEKFQEQDPSLMGNIKGCIVDSAPVAAPDPQVWASGFSAAFLKKQSVATKGSLSSTNSGIGIMAAADSRVEPKPAVVEAALLAVLEKFFGVVLNLPAINRRLSDVLDLLSSEQPKCPQLYIYSSADKVIPAKSVESFVEQQRKAGHEVRACDFVNSPHVDHFRNHPSLYASQLTAFLDDCVLTCCKDSL